MCYDTIFHCAALKHVDIGESFPDEFYETNYVGTRNIFEFSRNNGCNNFIFFSTDKAVLPINAYGYSKAMAEKYISAHGTAKIYRWGNIIGSRGSVIQSFVSSIKQGKDVSVTDDRMTRFWLTIDEAIDFVLSTYENSTYENPIIHPLIKSSSVIEVIDAICEILGKKVNVKITGIRPGEKLHECLRTGHDYCIRSDNCARYSKDELKEKLNKYIESTNK
jgi:FlaA1/EpsC-like NDP-sugar epimerase